MEMAERAFQQRDALAAVLNRYLAAYPAFRMKPIGAPGSEKRIEQENLMALEDTARAALAALTTKSNESGR